MVRAVNLRSLGASAVILAVGVLVFRQFLFGDALLLYKDIGSDSLVSYYPEFVHLSHYIRTAGYPSWSFYVGMGQDIAYLTGYLLWQPVTWLPSSAIAYALPWQHLAKVLVVGLLFFRFLTMLRLQSPAPLLGALLLAFSAYTTAGSCWYPLTDEVVAFTGLLLATERAIQSGKWLFVALASAAIGMVNPFFLYLCALFLICYLPLRLYLRHGRERRDIVRTCFALATIVALGVSLGAVVTLPYLRSILISPRGIGSASPLTKSAFLSFESARHYVTVLARLISNDLLGTGDGFRGWQNYLEAPLTYCGILSLLLFPLLFQRRGRGRNSVIVVCLILFTPTVLPWCRYVFWLFEGDYYRTYSLFCVLAVLTLSMVAFSRYVAGEKMNVGLLVATSAAWLSFLYLPFQASQALINPGVRAAATIYLCLYAGLLLTGHLLQRQSLAGAALVVVSVVELVHFNGISITKRTYLTKSEFEAPAGYNDETQDALRDIAAVEKTFFRVTKPRPAIITHQIALNDSLVFNYYGTSSYSSFNNRNYTNFLIAVGEIPPESELHTRWAIGTLNRPVLSTFACEKYALVDDPSFLEGALRYRPVGQYGMNYLFENELFLPLGLSFDRYISENDFLHLPPADRAAALLRVAVFDESSAAAANGLTQLSIADLAAETRTERIASVVRRRRDSALQLTSFRQADIFGHLHLATKSVVVIQTPFDLGWRAVVDGRDAVCAKTDAGLVGVFVDAGEHTVQLHYRNPYLRPGAIMSVLAAACILFGLSRWPKI